MPVVVNILENGMLWVWKYGFGWFGLGVKKIPKTGEG